MELCKDSTRKLPRSEDTANAFPLNVNVTPEAAHSLEQLLNGELQRHRAIVHIDNLRKDEAGNGAKDVPLLERLHDYPAHGVDLDNLVEFPPKMGLIPMKPIFLDVAWNYIDYPGKASTETSSTTPAQAAQEPAPPAPQPKKSWFSFGR